MTSISRLFILAPSAIIFLVMLVAGGTGSRLDEAIYLLLYAMPGIVAPARVATALGGWHILIPAALLGALYLALRRRRRDAFLLLAVALGGRLLVWLLKDIVARPRPGIEEHLVAVGSASFPSGHAANGLITWLALALLLPRRARSALVAAALRLSARIGLSRVVLGVHWPSDVIGGWALGLAWTLGLIALTHRRGLTGREGTPHSAAYSPSEGEER